MRVRLETIEIPRGATNTAHWLKQVWGELEASMTEEGLAPDDVDCQLVITAKQFGELMERVDFVAKIDQLVAVQRELAEGRCDGEA